MKLLKEIKERSKIDKEKCDGCAGNSYPIGEYCSGCYMKDYRSNKKEIGINNTIKPLDLGIRETLEDLVEYLKENQPYPEDIFIKIGEEARVGYNSCIHNINKYRKERLWQYRKQ